MDDTKQLTHERDLLAQALGDLLVAMGGLEQGMPATGPQLLLLASDAIDHFKGQSEPTNPRPEGPGFKLTWGWGEGKTFATHKELREWRGRNEEKIAGMFPPREHVLGVDGNWYEVSTDFCRECGASL